MKFLFDQTQSHEKIIRGINIQNMSHPNRMVRHIPLNFDGLKDAERTRSSKNKHLIFVDFLRERKSCNLTVVLVQLNLIISRYQINLTLWLPIFQLSYCSNSSDFILNSQQPCSEVLCPVILLETWKNLNHMQNVVHECIDIADHFEKLLKLVFRPR